MAVYLKPCTGCPLREGCEQRDEYRRRVSGLGLRSATFRCHRLDAALKPGTRILIRHAVAGSDCGPDGFELIQENLPATITSSNDGRFSCVVDRDAILAVMTDYGITEETDHHVDRYRFRRTMSARRIVEFLDEPRRKFCGFGRILLPTGTCDTRHNEDCDCKQFAPHIKQGAAA